MEAVIDNFNNIDVNDNTNNSETQKKNRRSKQELYTKERKMFIEKINNTIGLNETKNNVIYNNLCEMKN